MSKSITFNVDERERELQNHKNIYENILIGIIPKIKSLDIHDINNLHSAFVNYFNEFERMIDDFQNQDYKITKDLKIRLVEDGINIIDTLFNHWDLIRELQTKYNLPLSVPSPTAYASTQRLIKAFCRRKEIKDMRNKFIKNNLPTYGFDMKTTHSKFVTKNEMLRVQLPIGIVFLVIAFLLIFLIRDMSGFQYLATRILLSIGASSVITSLLYGTVKIQWKLSTSLFITATGGLAIFLALYFINPPSPPNPNLETKENIEKLNKLDSTKLK